MAYHVGFDHCPNRRHRYTFYDSYPCVADGDRCSKNSICDGCHLLIHHVAGDEKHRPRFGVCADCGRRYRRSSHRNHRDGVEAVGVCRYLFGVPGWGRSHTLLPTVCHPFDGDPGPYHDPDPDPDPDPDRNHHCSRCYGTLVYSGAAGGRDRHHWDPFGDEVGQSLTEVALVDVLAQHCATWDPDRNHHRGLAVCPTSPSCASLLHRSRTHLVYLESLCGSGDFCVPDPPSILRGADGLQIRVAHGMAVCYGSLLVSTPGAKLHP